MLESTQNNYKIIKNNYKQYKQKLIKKNEH
jgi:hypothetical protein